MGEAAERSEAEEGKQGWKALSVTFGDSSPSGRAKGCTYFGLRNGVYRYRYAPFTVLRLSIKERRRTIPFPERAAALYNFGVPRPWKAEGQIVNMMPGCHGSFRAFYPFDA